MVHDTHAHVYMHSCGLSLLVVIKARFSIIFLVKKLQLFTQKFDRMITTSHNFKLKHIHRFVVCNIYYLPSSN